MKTFSKWIAASLTAGVVGLGAFALTARAADNDTPAASAATQPDNQAMPGHLIGRFIKGEIGRLMVLHSQLDMSDAQKDQIKQIVLAHKSEILQVVQPLVDDRRALRDAVLADTPDEKAIRDAADKLGHDIGDAAVLAAKIKQEVSPVLTDDQKKQISDFRADSDHALDDLLKKLGENP